MRLVKQIQLLIPITMLLGFSVTGYAQPLDSLLRLLVENNPKLKALNSEYEAELQRIDQVSVLPNPTMGVGVPVLHPETRLGPQLVMVSASQMFPWFGALGAREDVVISISKAKFEEISALKLELFYQLKSSYYKLNFLRTKKSLLQKTIRLYESLENVALSNVESGQSSTADVLRLQIKIRDLKQQVQIIDNQESSHTAGINQLTKQDWRTKVTTPLEFEQQLLSDFDTATYRAKISKHHPLVARLNMKIEASQHTQLVNKKANSPTVGIGVDYSWVGERTDANPINNGQDILVPKLMLSIPIYRKAYKAKDMEELLHQQTLNYKKEALIDQIMRMLLQYKLDYDNSILAINLHKEQITTTQQTIDILLTDYSASGEGFDDLLQLENQLLEHEIGLVKGRLDMHIAVANIDRLTDF